MKGSKVNMSTKKTHEEFIAEAKNKNPYFDDVILLSEYKNARTKIIYQCKICNTISSVPQVISYEVLNVKFVLKEDIVVKIIFWREYLI